MNTKTKRQKAEALFKNRRHMLVAIAHHLDDPLYKAIGDKLTYEERRLIELIESGESKVRDEKAKALDTRFFTKQRLPDYV